jgi:hypothetical protein
MRARVRARPSGSGDSTKASANEGRLQTADAMCCAGIGSQRQNISIVRNHTACLAFDPFAHGLGARISGIRSGFQVSALAQVMACHCRLEPSVCAAWFQAASTYRRRD